jgi:REP element-mobilizing transposase RayT
MTHGRKIDNQDRTYFMTFTVVEWLFIFDDLRFMKIACDSLNFCVENKNLEIFTYVIMSSHIHLLARANNENLSKVVGSFKKFIAKKILKILEKETSSHSIELLKIFSESTKTHSRNEKYQFWKYGNAPLEIYSPKFTLEKIRYINNNPVEAGMVNYPNEYYYSSAVDYWGGKGPVKVSVIDLHKLI